MNDRILTTQMIMESGKYYFSARGENVLVCVDLQEKSHEILVRFSEICGDNEILYYSLVRCKEWIVCVPFAARSICLYNLNDKSVKYIPLELPKGMPSYAKQGKFWNGVVVEDNIYMLGCYCPAILKFNINDFSMEYISDWKKIINYDDSTIPKFGIFGMGSFVTQGHLVIPFRICNSFLSVDLKTNSSEVIETELQFEGIGGIAYSENKIWTVGRGKKSNKIVVMDSQYKIEKVIPMDTEREDIEELFYSPCVYNKKIVILPYMSRNMYVINDEGMRKFDACNMLHASGMMAEEGHLLITIISPILEEGKLVYISGLDYSWIQFSLEELKITQKCNINFSSQEIEQNIIDYCEKIEHSEKYYVEGVHGIGLNEYIRRITSLN